MSYKNIHNKLKKYNAYTKDSNYDIYNFKKKLLRDD